MYIDLWRFFSCVLMCEKSDVCIPKRNGVKQSEGHQLHQTIQNETQNPFSVALEKKNRCTFALHSGGDCSRSIKGHP